ncbi:MAG TPA: S9 family peptidase [Dongiaceae bacterium]|nr:S9 family peptidase [Dongiaceae bacterium]
MRTAAPPVLCALVLAMAPCLAAPSDAAIAKRPITIDDLNLLVDVSEPAISPDGAWVAYTVTRIDAKRDTTDDDLYMTSWDGARTVRLTSSKANENTPAFSPDGRWIAFLSRREHKDDERQLWLMSRDGGEGERVTDLPGGVSDYVFSPDGKRVVLVADDPEPEDEPPAGAADPDEDEEPTPRPIVIDRYQFKADVDGYLGAQRSHLYLLDIATRRTEAITSGPYDEHLPNWSPDGKTIVFVSKRSADPDRDDNYDLFLVEARAGAAPRRLTVNEVPDAEPDWESRPVFSPDGASIAYLEGGPLKDIYYAGYHLAVIPATGGARRLVVPDLDRNMTKPRWSPDGRSILFLLEDDGSVHLARVPAAGGRVERILAGPRTVMEAVASKDGRIAVLHTTANEPPEVFAVEGSTLRPLSKRNDDWLATHALATTGTISYKSNDGTEIHGFLVKPADYKAGRKYPVLLDIHGGPVSQYQHEFTFDWQVFAANGYVVVGPNPRGSSGRGEAFAKAIYADWGNKDGQDVRSAVDSLIAQGIADPERLAVSGWSYGGILSNYVIVQDQRFKAAVVGAGSSNFLADYGTDQYIREYDAELGPPWKNLDLWIRLSSAFLHADRITTPTLFMCGEADFNVPLLNSEQMYQALKTLGRDTELVIYPDQFHGLDTPSYLRDRIKRNVDWFAKHLGK